MSNAHKQAIHQAIQLTDGVEFHEHATNQMINAAPEGEPMLRS
jgi:hypothetical protein